MKPSDVNGTRQKNAYIQGMKDYRTGQTNCTLKGAMLFKYWMAGRAYAQKDPGADFSKGFRGLVESTNR